ncbi:MAG: P1 family peptidase [Henriciella sp.]|nr:P1 family peptidase [Henriciella sp.]MBO6694159.1 P1 family peptidase [Henriciella sp.]
MSQPGRNNLITDIAGLQVGNAHDEAALTGCTVIHCNTPCVAAVAVAGGGPGTRETDLLAPDKLVEAVNAIVLSGGSAYGLAAADGVAAMLGARGEGFAMVDRPGVPKTPIVPAAILYDLANGGDKSWQDAPPYQALGRTALGAASQMFSLGRAGAGYGARAGQHRGGLGSASIKTDDGIQVGAITAVNSFGSVYMPGTDAFWAWPFEVDEEFGGVRPPSVYSADAEDWGAAKQNPQARENTTIACIATDVALTPGQAQRVAQMALSGFSRAIRPVFAPFDGDVVFVLSTAQKELPAPEPLTLTRIGELAASALARAIARGVHEAQ